MMKRIFAGVLALVCVMGVMGGCAKAPNELTIDASKWHSFSGQDITNERLKEIVDNGEIPKNVEQLGLSTNQISDVMSLKALTSLRTLSLVDNQIIDITPLQSLTNLRNLSLDNNQINDISSLKSLVNLEGLRLIGNQLTQEQIDELQKALPNCEIIWE